MDEEESENLTEEDVDETGSLNESPLILKAASNKGRGIQTAAQMNSNTQNDTSNNLFKLSTSSIEGQNKKAKFKQ